MLIDSRKETSTEKHSQEVRLGSSRHLGVGYVQNYQRGTQRRWE